MVVSIQKAFKNEQNAKFHFKWTCKCFLMNKKHCFWLPLCSFLQRSTSCFQSFSSPFISIFPFSFVVFSLFRTIHFWWHYFVVSFLCEHDWNKSRFDFPRHFFFSSNRAQRIRKDELKQRIKFILNILRTFLVILIENWRVKHVYEIILYRCEKKIRVRWEIKILKSGVTQSVSFHLKIVLCFRLEFTIILAICSKTYNRV